MRWLVLWLGLMGCTKEGGARLVFAGDLAPARGVVTGVKRAGNGVWDGIFASHPIGSRWVVNLEADWMGTGRTCVRSDGLCLGVPEELAPVLADGPFVVLSRANNHAADFGGGHWTPLGSVLQPVSGASVQLDDVAGADWTLAFVELTRERAHLDAAVRAVSLGRAQGRLAGAMLHSGPELMVRPDPGQVDAIEELVTAGALVVVGSGAHVVQSHDCEGAAVWAGLGNLWMDQRPADTQVGLSVGCRVGGELSCTAVRMRHDARTAPWPDGEDGTCVVGLPPEVDRDWQQHPASDAFAQVVPLVQAQGVWLALWPQHSAFDDAVELRPHVFSTQGRRVTELWRGTALSAPIAYARSVPAQPGDVCVMHRTDSVFKADADSGMRRWQRWRWNGFGFDAVDGACGG